MITIRDAREEDLQAIVDIYNESIPSGRATADTRPILVADRVEWLRNFDPTRRPIWVAEDGGQAGNILLAMNIGLILGGPLWGAVSDRVFKTPKWVVGGGLLVLALITFILRALPPGTSTLLAGAIFLAFGIASASGMHVYAHIKALVPKDMAGAAMSGTNFFTMMGPAVFLQGLGIVMQGLYPEASRGPQAFSTALLICIVCQAAIRGLYLFTRSK